MSPYDDGYVSFMYVCMYARMFHLYLLSLLSSPLLNSLLLRFLLPPPPLFGFMSALPILYYRYYIFLDVPLYSV